MKPDPAGQPAATIWKVLGRARTSPPPLAGEVGERSEPGGGMGTRSVERPLPNPPPHAGEGEHRASGKREFQYLTWLALEPLTGRTHQLRVHCAAMGWPIVGDSIYGHAPRTGGPVLHLHAREVVVPLYKNRDPIRASAPVPEHMKERLKACGWGGETEKQPAASLTLSRPYAEEAAKPPSRSMGPPHPSRRGPADRSSG